MSGTVENSFTWVAILFGHTVLSIILGDLVGRIIGSRTVWVMLFLLLPGLGHLLFLFVWWDNIRKRRSQKVLGDLVSMSKSQRKDVEGKSISITPFGIKKPSEPDSTGEIPTDEPLEIKPVMDLGFSRPDSSVTPFGVVDRPPDQLVSRIEPDHSKEEPLSLTPFGDLPAEETGRPRLPDDEIFSRWRDRDIDRELGLGEWEKAYGIAKEKLGKAKDAGDLQSIDLYEAYLKVPESHIEQIKYSDPDETDTNKKSQKNGKSGELPN